jgi:hypothetical protein
MWSYNLAVFGDSPHVDRRVPIDPVEPAMATVVAPTPPRLDPNHPTARAVHHR